MTEVDHETGHWAWKREVGDDGTRSLKAAEKLKGSAREVAMKAKEQAITSPDGRLTLLRGDVRFTNVTFGYNPDKPVLHGITWFAKPGQKDRARRRHRCRQDHRDQPHQPVLRHSGRPDSV